MSPQSVLNIKHIIEAVDAALDAAHDGDSYGRQPLAQTWARVTKVSEEAAEARTALSNMTGENPRKGYCGTLNELTEELGDTASAALLGIQHLLKDKDLTWEVFEAALLKAYNRFCPQEDR